VCVVEKWKRHYRVARTHRNTLSLYVIFRKKSPMISGSFAGKDLQLQALMHVRHPIRWQITNLAYVNVVGHAYVVQRKREKGGKN